MTTIKLRAALMCAVLLAGAGAAASAQAPGAPVRPDAPPQVEAPDVPVPVEQETETPRTIQFRRPIFRGAQDYTLQAGDIVREVRSVLGNVTIEGRVEGDVLVIVGSARLAGTAVVEGSVVVVGGSASIDAGAAIERDLVVIGGTLTAPPGFSPDGEHVVIGTPWFGNTLRGVVPWVTRGLLWGRLIVPDLGWVWMFVGVFFFIYLVLNTVFDRPVAAAADVLAKRPLTVFFTGLIVLLLTGPVLTIIAASVIGLAIVPFVLCALIVAALLGKAAVARALGRGVLRPESPDAGLPAFATFAIGFVLLTIAYMIPVLGFVTWALTSVLGLGAAFMTFRTFWRSERPPRVPAVAVAAPVAAAAAVPEGAGFTPPYNAPPSPAFDTAPVDAPSPPPRAFAGGLAQYPRAAFLDRVAAFVLDAVLVAIANALLGMDRYEGFFPLLLLAYHIAFWAWKGTTLGGIIIGLRVIRTHGAEMRPADALVRGLSAVFSIGALGLGCFWMLQDAERQMWHDKIAGTLVVKVPREVALREH